MAKARDCKSLIPGSNPGAASKLIYARVAELADAQDLKSCEAQPSYRFDSGLGHHEYQAFRGFFCLSKNRLKKVNGDN